MISDIPDSQLTASLPPRQLLGNMEKEGLGSLRGAYVDPLEPPGLSKEEILEW